MTIGDKIQFYRKELGLSQEELAQKLLVSRQTISLWEKGQTSPTIDNLIRLKEILGVSVDEILEIKNDIPADPILPAELYQFNYSIEELTEIYKCLRNRLIKRPILFFVTYAALLLSCLGTSVPDIFTGVVLGVFLVGIASHIRGIRAFKKIGEKATTRLPKAVMNTRFMMIISLFQSKEMAKRSGHRKPIFRTLNRSRISAGIFS